MSITNIRAKNKNISEIRILNELIKLMKPRVMSLVIFTCAVGLLTSPTTVPVEEAMMGILFVAMGAGAAGTLNMWYEADLDKLMSRTCLRPIPRGNINKNQALIFGLLLSLISVVSLYYFSNALSAFLLFFTIFFYVIVYTIWLKRKTSQNIVIGGASGALPPVIGWTIANNSLTLEPLTLFLIIFIWTPSHFWALSLYKANDYKKAKIPMLPITDGIQNTKKNILIYSLLMIPAIVMPYLIGFAGLTFLIPSLGLTLYYNYICFNLYNFKKDKFDTKIARQIFSYSIIYLFLVFVLFLLDKLI
tara:strand:+ start:337 stop:1248 length:912 start_codon:yes stop_codon:yes gene_type:complete